MSKRAFYIILGIIFLTFAVMWIWNKVTPPKTSAPTPQTSDWKKFDYPELGILLSLPPDFVESSNGEYSKSFARISESPNAKNSVFLYFSVVPAGVSTQSAEFYNYNNQDFQTMISMQDGETKNLRNSENPEVNKYFNYQKVGNVTIEGYSTKSYINTKPWEFPSGTTEYRFITEFANVNYIIGGYLGLDVNSPTYISREEFNKILETVKFTPVNVKKENRAIPTSEWGTFLDEAERLTFIYPKNWQVQTDSKQFQDGDLFAINITGQSQKTQTELYDGASFAVMEPVFSEKEVLPWMKDKYIGQVNPEVNNQIEFSEEVFASRIFHKAIVCGLGCFSYYHFKQAGKIFGFVFFAAGPDKEIYTEDFRKIMESVSFRPWDS